MKTACIYHSIDLDGWMSAAIVKHWFATEHKGEEVNIINYNNFIDLDISTINQHNLIVFIGYNYGQPIPDLSEYDKVIMCDISFPENEMYKLCITKDFIWNDHHASALAIYENIRQSLPSDTYYAKGLRGVQFAACELTWQYFFPNEPMPEIVRLLGRYDCFGHKGTDEEQKVLEFQYGARQCISNYEEAYKYLKIELNSYLPNPNNYDREENPIYKIWNSGKSIYQYLCTEAKQVYKNGFEIKFNIIEELFDDRDIFNPQIHKSKRTYKFICINRERFNPINFGIDYHKDGYDGCACFHYDGVANLWRFSLYNDNGLVDCSQIAKQYGGGGHRGASGFTCDNNTFLSFIKNHGNY